MASLVPLLLLLIFSSSSTTSSSLDIAHATVAAGVGDELNHHVVVVPASSVEPSPVCHGHRVTPSDSGSWVPLSRPHGPCSSAGGSTAVPAVADTLRWDEHRAAYIQRKLSGTPQPDADVDEEPAETTQVEYGGAAKPNIGTASSGNAVELGVSPAATGGAGPGVAQSMVIDTTSDVPWVQCLPCPPSQCHPQTDAFYDPSKSATSTSFPCNSPTCRGLGRYANGCTGAGNTGQCQYRVQYPDGSATSGTYISDVLTLNPTGVIGNFQFGCSHALQRPGSFSNKTSGIMALARGDQSLPSQVTATYGAVFSYCLPPTVNHKGFLLVGVPNHSAARYALTPMLQIKAAPMLYLVRLNAIDVAGQRLAVPPTVFSAGAVMDSRTIITRLPPTAYMALRAAFRAQMRAYRAVGPKGPLDTCYDFTGVRGGPKVPNVTLVFDGRNAAVELDQSGILLGDCLAFASNSNDRMTGIIGNAQQQTLEVLYNVGAGLVGFRRGAC